MTHPLPLHTHDPHLPDMYDPHLPLRPLFSEGDLTTHRLDVNPEAALFYASDEGATEEEYLLLLAALVGVFKPTHMIETGTWNGAGAAALLAGADPGAHVWTFNDDALPARVLAMLDAVAARAGNTVECLQVNTVDLMRGRTPRAWAEITGGRATFAFLDTGIACRAEEFEYISDPASGVLDFSRPLCVCVHDTSRYRHPSNHETGSLADTLRRIGAAARRRGWQALRLHQSRGLYVLTHEPEAAGIDGACVVPEELLWEQDVCNHGAGEDPYLITEYYPLLADLVRRRRPRTVLEIGVRYGYGLGVMLDAGPSIEAAFAVDTTSLPLPVSHGASPGAYGEAQKNLTRLHEQSRWPGLRALQFFDCDTQTVTSLPLARGLIDLAYVDGDHTVEGCVHDLDLVLPHMRPGGAVVVDDADLCGLRAMTESWAAAHGFATDYVPDSSGRGRVTITLPAKYNAATGHQGDG